ncbi:MAG: DNA replication protein DnaD, partial [Clostridium sp.]
MELHFENRIQVNATSVSNEFIDRYMAEANGEYIKVYLYLLRHSGEAVTVVSIADALNHTEADVHRALSYWQKAGVLGLLPEQVEVLGKADSLGKADPLGKAEPVEEDRVTKEVSAACEERIATDQKQSSPTQRSHCTGREMEHLSSEVEYSQIINIEQKYMNNV